MSQPLELMTVLKELYNISGFRVSLHDVQMNEIAAYPPQNSRFCSYIQKRPANRDICVQTDSNAFATVSKDEQIYIYRCKFGLYEAIAPLYDFDRLAGYLMMGQVRDCSENSAETVFAHCRDCVDDPEQLRREISTIPTCSKEKIVSYINIMRICAEYITLTNRMNLSDRNLTREVRAYLNKNYAQKLSIDQLARQFMCSKSTIMNSFKRNYHVTVNQYLTSVRLDHACQLLKRRGMSIREVAERCGFSDQNYFSKVFIRAMGMTPTKYREQLIQEEDASDVDAL